MAQTSSVFVYVKHYLTPVGIDYFQEQWFPKVVSMIRKQPGFVSIEYTTVHKEPDCLFISLVFKDGPTFEAWCAVPEHDALIGELDRFRSRKYWEAVRTDNGKEDSSRLNWDVIQTQL